MKLAAIGSNCIDFYSNLEGGKPFPGGGPVNMAVYTLRIGGKASYIGAVGDDDYGKIMQEAMSGKGVDISHLYVKRGKTAVSRVELQNGERVFGEYREGVLAEFQLSEEDKAFILTHDVVVADLWGRVEGEFAQLQKSGIRTAFDCANHPDAEAAKRAVPYADYLFFSAEDEDRAEIREKMKAIREDGAKMVICMLGKNGSLCFDGKEFYRYGIKECRKTVDTMGAGDSYIAGFLKGITEGMTVEKAMELGAATAADTLSYFGAW
ncbi:MAG: fructoselysine 6-kinase [Lachnospiraceae bacterium]|nr:fructoselysine 6-kinase [Lachnospiraceae bacterium]